MIESFSMPLNQIQPSQLYVSTVKLAAVLKTLEPHQPHSMAPIPIRRLDNQVVYTDGHTRAFAAWLCGWTTVPVYWDPDDLDWEAYAICVAWCKEAGIHTIADLQGRVVGTEQYAELWLARCAAMQQDLNRQRSRPPELSTTID